MARYIFVSLLSGVLFGIMDGLINANQLAQRLYAVFKPITRTSVNFTAGILIDLFYGFVMAAIFLLLYTVLPGNAGISKGISFGLIVWFFRVVMSAASQWMIFDVSVAFPGYIMVTGLIEMLIIGVVYGWLLRPTG